MCLMSERDLDCRGDPRTTPPRHRVAPRTHTAYLFLYEVPFGGACSFVNGEERSSVAWCFPRIAFVRRGRASGSAFLPLALGMSPHEVNKRQVFCEVDAVYLPPYCAAAITGCFCI